MVSKSFLGTINVNKKWWTKVVFFYLEYKSNLYLFMGYHLNYSFNIFLVWLWSDTLTYYLVFIHRNEYKQSKI